LRDPLGILRKAYDCAGLDVSKVSKLRFKAKAHMQADGSHGTRFQPGKHYWFKFDEISQILESDVNRFQASQLEPEVVEIIASKTYDVRARLGYLTNDQ
jgi:hypothetical protein